MYEDWGRNIPGTEGYAHRVARESMPKFDGFARLDTSEGLKVARVPEILASDLRRRIMSGDLPHASELPRQEELMAYYGVSRPSLREAMVILESEGLITVRRGKLGGAIVTQPDLNTLARAFGLVLDAQNVPILDMSEALNRLEPQCAALCALRDDRHDVVLPILTELQDESRDAVDDFPRFTIVARRFPEAIVELCGNQSLILVVGALESVLTRRAQEWARRSEVTTGFPEMDYRRQGLRDHQTIIDLISVGNAEAVASEASRHLRWAPIYSTDEEGSSGG